MPKTFENVLPLGWSDSEEREFLMGLREPKLANELKIPRAKVEFGAINPFQLEEVKRYLQNEMAEGRIELISEPFESLTGRVKKMIKTGRWKLSEKGLKELTRRNKDALEKPEVD